MVHDKNTIPKVFLGIIHVTFFRFMFLKKICFYTRHYLLLILHFLSVIVLAQLLIYCSQSYKQILIKSNPTKITVYCSSTFSCYIQIVFTCTELAENDAVCIIYILLILSFAVHSINTLLDLH